MGEFKIWIDADACPRSVKDLVYRASERHKIPVTLVANSFQSTPTSEIINFVKVKHGDDVADLYIVDNLQAGDLVITADIPLASLVVDKDATAINPRGELYTEENIKSRLSMRDFMHDLRGMGVETGGPAPFSDRDSHAFANSLNRIICKKNRAHKS